MEVKWIFRELKNDFIERDTKRRIHCWKVIHTDDGGSKENELVISFMKDGSLHLKSTGGNQWLRKEQIDFIFEQLYGKKLEEV